MSVSCLSLVELASRGLFVPSSLLGVLPNTHRDLPFNPLPLPVESQSRERIAVTFHHGDTPNLLLWLIVAEM